MFNESKESFHDIKEEREMTNDDSMLIHELEEEEKRLHDLKLPLVEKVGWQGMSQMLDIALRHPRLADILGSEMEEIDDPRVLEKLFPENSDEERKIKVDRFFTLLSIFLKADNDPDEWLQSQEAQEFEDYLLNFKHMQEKQ